MHPVGDLHCDFLSYLAKDKKRHVHHPEARCSLPQLQKGRVALQSFALYALTGPGSVEQGEAQLTAFKELFKKEFLPLKPKEPFALHQGVHGVLALENASSLCEEEEPLERAFERLTRFQHEAGPILYVSLTWNHENRFGGGNKSPVGLKRDGELLLEFLSGRGIAIDFSHTSDALAEGILNHIDKRGLQLMPIASHSNFRAVTDHPRNLPNGIAREIIRRRGVIGLNLIRSFVGPRFTEDFVRHLVHGLALGAHQQLCLGADFFYEGDFPNQENLLYFDERFGDSSCYPDLLHLCQAVLEPDQIAGLAHGNLNAFLQRL